MTNVNAVLTGAVAMASFVAALFFLRYWSQTRDEVSSCCFRWLSGVDCVTRFYFGVQPRVRQAEPYFYLARLVTFSLIILGIPQKSRSTHSR